MLIALLAAALAPADSTTFVRVNQVGYLPEAPKVAVACSLDSARLASFVVQDSAGRVVFGPRRAEPAAAFGPCRVTHRLAREECPAYTEYFKSRDAVPDEKCDVHVGPVRTATQVVGGFFKKIFKGIFGK